MVGIQAYMSIRRHVSDSGCSAFEYIDDRSQGDGGKVCLISYCFVSIRCGHLFSLLLRILYKTYEICKGRRECPSLLYITGFPVLNPRVF